jgi:hypothetical protein
MAKVSRDTNFSNAEKREMIKAVRQKKLTPDEILADEIARFYDNPLGYVLFNFPWEDPNAGIQVVELPPEYQKRFPGCKYGPDKWACEFLDQIGDEVRKRKFDGKTPVEPLRFATVSGHGIGKSTITAWIILWIMDTRPFCRGTVTAGTADQLRTKTWAEVGKWHKLALTREWHDYSATRGNMMLKNKQNPETWFFHAQTCKEENSEAFAGQHAANSTSAYVVDEASGVPNKIYEVMAGGLTDGEPMQFLFGNGTKNTGNFYEACEGKDSRFIARHIDSRDVQITNKKYFADMLKDSGEDSDFFRVRCRGLFPKGGTVQFISGHEVEQAIMRPIYQDRSAPLIIGVDVADKGMHASVIYPRLGWDARSFPYKLYRNITGIQLAEKIIHEIIFFRQLGITKYHVFIDSTGGYGGSPLEHLQFLGYQAVGVNFGGTCLDKDNYRYKGDEMWGRMRDGIRTNLALPNDPEVEKQLTQREFGLILNDTKVHLETKQEMEERGLDSPDIADALALTFAFDVAPSEQLAGEYARGPVAASDYDPYDMSAFTR